MAMISGSNCPPDQIRDGGPKLTKTVVRLPEVLSPLSYWWGY